MRMPFAKGTIIHFKNCQLSSRELVHLNGSREELFILKTNENTIFISSQNIRGNALFFILFFNLSLNLDNVRSSFENIDLERLSENSKGILIKAGTGRK